MPGDNRLKVCVVNHGRACCGSLAIPLSYRAEVVSSRRNQYSESAALRGELELAMDSSRYIALAKHRFRMPRALLLALIPTLVSSAGLVFPNAIPASADAGGYPYYNMACVVSPYGTTGNGPNWCAGYNWGTIRNNTSAASELSPYGYDYRNCTDYVAWRLSTLHVKPAQYKGLGNAKAWGANASGNGLVDNGVPAVGSVAVDTTGTFGHVAFVTAVKGNTITVAQYNRGEDGNYSAQSGTPGQLGFSSFVHFERYESGSPGTPPSITTTSLPAARVATSYSAAVSASGGSVPYAWSLSAGSLPPGLSINPSGAISGMPGQAGSFSFSVKVTGGGGGSATKALTISVSPQYENAAALGPNNSLDFYYNTYGTPAWGLSVVAGAGTTDSAPSIAMMANGETVIAAQGANNSLDFYYNIYGTPAWNLTVVAGAGTTDSAPSIAMMANGETVIAAQGANNSLDFYYNIYGTPAWNLTVVAGAGTTDSAPSIATMANGEAVITAQGPGDSLDFYYNTYGTPQWPQTVVAGAGTTDSAPSIATMANGEAVITAQGPGDSLDFYYNTYGTPAWNLTVVAGAGTTDSAPSIAMMANGETVIAAQGANNSLDFYYNI